MATDLTHDPKNTDTSLCLFISVNSYTCNAEAKCSNYKVVFQFSLYFQVNKVF